MFVAASSDLALYGASTGMGPSYAATLSSPADVPFYVHRTWPGLPLCQQQTLLLQDYAYQSGNGWVGQPSSSNGAYNGTFLVRALNSAVLCPEPLLTCGNQEPRACLAAAYAAADPDKLEAAGAAAAAAAASRDHGLRVVLPAVLCSVHGCLNHVIPIHRATTAHDGQAGRSPASLRGHQLHIWTQTQQQQPAQREQQMQAITSTRSMAAPGRGGNGRGGAAPSAPALLLWLLALCGGCWQATSGAPITVGTGWELHAALASPNVTDILVTANITMSLDTCPFPSHPMFAATMIGRDVTISGQQPAAAGTSTPTAAAAAAGGGGRLSWDCNYLSDRFTLQANHTVTVSNLLLQNCRTYSTLGFFSKSPGSVIVLNNTVNDQGSVCLPLPDAAAALQAAPRASTNLPASTTQQPQQQVLSLVPGPAGGSAPAALLLTDTAAQEAPTNSSHGSAFTLRTVNSSLLCPRPVSRDCIAANGTTACMRGAFASVDPDQRIGCPAVDGYSLHNCLTDQSHKLVVLLQTAHMNVSTCPPELAAHPFLIARNVTIMSDPRGPRLTFDCGGLSDRVQMAPGLTLTLQHIILANCSTPKPVNIMRMSAGVTALFNDSLIVGGNQLCLPIEQEAALAVHESRPQAVAGIQRLTPANPGAWCTSGDPNPNNSRPAAAEVHATDNTSYDLLIASDLALYGASTGMGPFYAATLSSPADVPFYVHRTWPGLPLCQQQALLLQDYAYQSGNGWVGQPSSSNGAYNGTFLVRALNSAVLCPEPLLTCGNQEPRACLAAAYAAADPDKLEAAGAAVAAAAASRDHGLRVVLPAVLCSVVGSALLVLLALFALFKRDQRRAAKQAATTLPKVAAGADAARGATSGGVGSPTYQPLGSAGGSSGSRSAVSSGPGSHAPNDTGFFAWLVHGGSTQGSAASSDPARRLLGVQQAPGGSTPASRQTASGPLAAHPEGISLSVLLGAGSFGRVYQGTWNGSPVAVKVITHSRADDPRIQRELSLSLSFSHPNLVRALHYVQMRLNPGEPSLGEPSSVGSADLFLPEGAVGVFSLPSTWAVIQRGTAGQPAPQIDTETWIVMDLCERGNLAAAIRAGCFTAPGPSGGPAVLAMAPLLRRAADVAAGLSYLHARNVCHGDMKCENILLQTEPQDPDGVMAKIADFGLSRALAFGQSHLSTKRYGTVTMMPPELLVSGKLTPAADVFSFGIMMWQFVTGRIPFAGLHHGEVIHRVVTQDARPGPWPPTTWPPAQASDKHGPAAAGGGGGAAGSGLAEPAVELHPDFIPLAEACWSRSAADRPSMPEVLQRLLQMLADVMPAERPEQQA